MTSESRISDSTKNVDQARLQDFMGKVVNDLGATWSAVLVIIGDKLGLYKAMADSKPISAAELASRTGTLQQCSCICKQNNTQCVCLWIHMVYAVIILRG